jgi:hypothetical protein
MEKEIKKKLIERGFKEKTLLNNRGLISACIEETKEQLILSGVVKSLKAKERKAFHVFAEINNYTKCFEGYKRDGKTFSETEVLKRHNTYLESL